MRHFNLRLFYLFLSSFFIFYSSKGLALESTYVKWGGEYRLRALYLDNLSSGASELRDNYDHRIMLNGDFAPNDLVQAYFSFNITDRVGGNKYGRTGELIEQDEADFNIFQAYGEWSWGERYFLKFGRMTLDWGNEALVSSNMDDAKPLSFDGLVLSYDAESFLFETGFFRIGDWAATLGEDNLDPDETAYMISLKLKTLPPVLENAQAYFLRIQSDNYTNSDLGVSIVGSSLNRVGLALKGGYSRFYYQLDYVNVSGSQNSDQSIAGSMFHGVLGVSESDTFKARFYMVGHKDTGDESSSLLKDETYRPIYYNHHMYGGLMDVLSWGNSTYYGLGTEFFLGDKNKFLVQLLRFSLSDLGTGPKDLSFLGYGDDSSFINESVSKNSLGKTSKSLGLELDLQYKREFLSGAYIEFLSGVFLPDTYFKSYGASKNIYSFRVTTGFEF